MPLIREATFCRGGRVGKVWIWCICLVGWLKSRWWCRKPVGRGQLAVQSLVYERESSLKANIIGHFCTWFFFGGNVRDSLILCCYFIFVEEICFVDRMWCSELLRRGRLFYFKFCLLSVHIRPICKVNQKDI